MGSQSQGYGGQDGPPALTVRKPLVNLDRDWVADAECRKDEHEGVDFFAKMGDPVAVEAARNVCSRCPVWMDCLDFALDNDIEFGVWGGMTPAERGGMGVAVEWELT